MIISIAASHPFLAGAGSRQGIDRSVHLAKSELFRTAERAEKLTERIAGLAL